MGFVAWRSFWISDDALITFRSVLNFVHGDGFRFNLSERVLASTHPGWAALLALGSAVGLPVAGVSLWLSLLLMLGALTLLVFAPPGRPGLLVASLLIVILFASRTFIDFSSSGLETPLTAFLILATASLLPVSFVGAAAAAGVALLSRMDLLFALALPLAFEWWRMMRAQTPDLLRTSTKAALLFIAPTLAVVVGSWWYYGYPLPNTAVAKLSSSISVVERIQYGFAYWRDSSVYFDPVPFALLVGALAMALVARSGRALAWAGGGVMHAAYVVWVGGDFMAGRFTHTALLFSLCGLGIALAEIRHHAGWGRLVHAARAMAMVAFAAILIWGGTGAWVVISEGADFRNQEFFGAGLLADEKGFYTRYHHWSNIVPLLIVNERMRWGADARVPGSPTPLVVCGGLGSAGMFVGPVPHVVDLCGLSDAFLARLPPVKGQEWRAGHGERSMPQGYYESLIHGRNLLTDETLRPLLDAVWGATRAPLSGSERFSAAATLWQYRSIMDRAQDRARGRSLAERSAMQILQARDEVLRQTKVSIPRRDPAYAIRLSLIPLH